MNQDERWETRYLETVRFIKENHRNPSRYDAEDTYGSRFTVNGSWLLKQLS